MIYLVTLGGRRFPSELYHSGQIWFNGISRHSAIILFPVGWGRIRAARTTESDTLCWRANSASDPTFLRTSALTSSGWAFKDLVVEYGMRIFQFGYRLFADFFRVLTITNGMRTSIAPRFQPGFSSQCLEYAIYGKNKSRDFISANELTHGNNTCKWQNSYLVGANW